MLFRGWKVWPKMPHLWKFEIICSECEFPRAWSAKCSRMTELHSIITGLGTQTGLELADSLPTASPLPKQTAEPPVKERAWSLCLFCVFFFVFGILLQMVTACDNTSKPFVGCFKSLLCHRDSEGGEHAQELSFCIVVPDSARKGHRETRGNSSEKIQRSRDSPCTWWDNTFYIFEYSITYRYPKLYVKYSTLHLSGQRPLQKHWVLKLVKVGFCRGFLHFVGQFQMWGTRPEAPPDPKVNAAICLDELLHLPMFHQTYWWTCIFFGRHNWPLNFVRWVLPSLQYRRREKTFFQQKIQLQNWFGLLVARP